MDKITSFAFISLIAALASSCSPTNYLTMNVTNPAPVYLSAEAKKVGVINRSAPNKGNEKWDKIDKVLSIEGKNLDKEGAEKATLGLRDELDRNERFTTVKNIQDNSIEGVGMDVFPAPLTWDEVNAICKKQKVDALFELAFYDTDGNVQYASHPVEVKTAVGISVPAVEHEATVTTIIKTGWRIYDPFKSTIQDEYISTQTVVSNGRGINPVKAINAVTGRKQQVLQTSLGMGQLYSYRIVPKRIRVSRDYYVRGTNNFEIGKRRAIAGDWDGAADLWYKEVENPDPKIAGRAHYNMGIHNEINGDLDAAIEWVAKSYTDYNDRNALRYLNILRNRQADNALLEQQKQ